MRMRKKAWARPELDACPYFIKNPQELKGNWSNWFPKKQPLHLELGCGKGVFLSELAVKHPDLLSGRMRSPPSGNLVESGVE